MTDSFKDKFADVLLRSGKSKVEIADKVGVSHAFIHHLINGTKTPTLSRLGNFKAAFPLSEAEYGDLLDALIREDSEFSAVAHHIEQHYFTYFYVPFLTTVLRGDRPSSNSPISLKQLEESRFLGTDLWLGYVNFEMRYPKYGNQSLRFFIGRTAGEEIRLSWDPFKKLGPAPTVPKIPSTVQFTFKLSSSISLSNDQLQKAITRTLPRPRVDARTKLRILEK